jgi:hypothetical protein
LIPPSRCWATALAALTEEEARGAKKSRGLSQPSGLEPPPPDPSEPEDVVVVVVVVVAVEPPSGPELDPELLSPEELPPEPEPDDVLPPSGPSVVGWATTVEVPPWSPPPSDVSTDELPVPGECSGSERRSASRCRSSRGAAATAAGAAWRT